MSSVGWKTVPEQRLPERQPHWGPFTNLWPRSGHPSPHYCYCCYLCLTFTQCEHVHRTYNNIAMRLDAVDPESILDQSPSSAQQLLQLTEGKRSHQAGDVDNVAGRSSSWPRRRPTTYVDRFIGGDWQRPYRLWGCFSRHCAS